MKGQREERKVRTVGRVFKERRPGPVVQRVVFRVPKSTPSWSPLLSDYTV